MFPLVLDRKKGKALRVLCIGAHCDDIEIGCGGTLQVLQRSAHETLVDFVVLSGSAERRREAQLAMNAFVRPRHRGEMSFGDFPDGRFPAAYSGLKDLFESLKARPRPDLVLCHERNDRHQDHRIVNEMVWSTFRDHLVLEYEIPKWDGGLGQPNVYVPLTTAQVRRKADALLRVYRSQSGRDWFTRESFAAMLRVRGAECRSPSGYAEAFHGRKLQLAAG